MNPFILSNDSPELHNGALMAPMCRPRLSKTCTWLLHRGALATPMCRDNGHGYARAQRRVDHTRRLSTQAESVHEVFAHVPSCASRGRPLRTQLLHAALGGATFCSPCLRVFVPHDFGFQTIRIAEENAQGSAEIGNGAIRGS